MTAKIALSDKVGAVAVVVILGGLAVGINHFQKLDDESTNQIPATPARELTAIRQTYVSNTHAKSKAGIPIAVTRGRHGQHIPAHG
jgi:hypothetical protein